MLKAAPSQGVSVCDGQEQWMIECRIRVLSQIPCHQDFSSIQTKAMAAAVKVSSQQCTCFSKFQEIIVSLPSCPFFLKECYPNVETVNLLVNS